MKRFCRGKKSLISFKVRQSASLTRRKKNWRHEDRCWKLMTLSEANERSKGGVAGGEWGGGLGEKKSMCREVIPGGTFRGEQVAPYLG